MTIHGNTLRKILMARHDKRRKITKNRLFDFCGWEFPARKIPQFCPGVILFSQKKRRWKTCVQKNGLWIGNLRGQQAATIRPEGEMSTVIQHLATLLACLCTELHGPGPWRKKKLIQPPAINKNGKLVVRNSRGPKQQSLSEGDPTNPNHQVPNHQLTIT